MGQLIEQKLIKLIVVCPFGTHQLLIYADDVNMLGGNVHTIKKNTESLVFASKKIGLEVNVDKTKYAVMSREQKVDEVTF